MSPLTDTPRFRCRTATLAAAGALLLSGATATTAGAMMRASSGERAAPAHASTTASADYVPGRVVVGYTSAASSREVAEVSRQLGERAPGAASTDGALRTRQQVLRLPHGTSVAAAVRRLRGRADVAYAVPDYIAHAAGSFIPNDPGRGTTAQGWTSVQWNFMPTVGVNAPQAWANLIADHRAGASGVTVAVLDTGVAYRNWRAFKQSPDFATTKFVYPYDFIAHNAYPLDREGHGTFVAGTIAEATNNGIGVTGLAYNATVMPVRVLNSIGNGDAATIAQGIRYAVSHGAQVINLSVEFGLGVSANEIPEIISALSYANSKGVVVVAAAGNDSGVQIAYPARDPYVISVGATTKDRCLANYSNVGPHLSLVAPGGGDDAALAGDPDCHPGTNLPDVYQEGFPEGGSANRFGLPGGWYGTSMATPHVAAIAAMVIASGVIGRHPSPAAVAQRLQGTADALGNGQPNTDYGWGLVDAGAATSPNVPTNTTTTPPTTTTTTTTPTATTTTPTTTTTGTTAPTATAPGH